MISRKLEKKERDNRQKYYIRQLPRKIKINKEEIAYQKEIAAEFNIVLKNICPKLVCEIPNPSKLFEIFMKQVDKKHIAYLQISYKMFSSNVEYELWLSLLKIVLVSYMKHYSNFLTFL